MRLIDGDAVMERIEQAYKDMGVDTHGIWNKQLAEIFKTADVEDIRMCLHKILGAVAQAPTIDRPQEWIPCSERLPEKAGHYLCSFKKANRIDSIYVDLAYWTGGRWYGYLANEINAWMPLPEPWKGADDE